ncbi:MAG TPA: hypothetical protein VL442_22915, partial [Mucilaginibacter sp.]|nr:hypothetical protein [Mucilaginibacter sp.]
QDVEDQKKRLEQLLEGVKTYETERENLTAVYQTKRKDLIEKGKTDEAKVLDQQYKEQIGRLDDANFEKLQSVKELYSGINQMSKASAQQLINDVQAELNARLAANEITDAEAKKVQQTINKAQESLNLRTPESLMQAGQYISELGQSLSNTNGTMAQFVSEAGSAISAVGNLDKMTVKLNADLQYNKEHLDDQKSTFGDYVNLVASGLTAVVNIIGSVTSASAARKKAEEDYYNSVIEFQNQYNIALDEELRLKSQKDGNIFLTSYSAEIKDAVNSYKAASEQYEKSLQDLQAGQAKVGQKNKVSGSAIASDAAQGAVAGAAIGSVVPVIGTTIGAIGGAVIGGLVGLFGGKKKADVFAPLLQVYPQLIDANGKFNESLAKTLINTNQVSDKTKILLQNTISYYDEEQQSIDQINSALSNLAQNLGVNLQSALVQAFETGGDAAKAFEGTVSSVIGNIVQQFLFEDIFSSEFDKLNAKLKDTVLAGGSEGDITADFVDFFKQAAPLAQKFTDGLKAAKDAAAQDGIDLFTNPNASSSTPNTMAGAIKGITESQANILEGVERGMQLSLVNIGETLEINLQTQQEQLSEMKQQTLLQMQIAANTKRSADNTDVLPKMIPEMNESLKNINKNTADTSGNILRAAGLV